MALLAAAIAAALTMTGAVLPTVAAAAAPPPLAAGDTFTAEDGATLVVAALNPPSRLSAMVAVYTPAFGATTKTNQFGGEAVLVANGTPGGYTVKSVCTALAACVDSRAGNNAIPADGVVLSVSPGGSPDVRAILRDHVKVGDDVGLGPVIERTATTTLDSVDPTAENNPPGVDASGACYPGCRGGEQLVQYSSVSGRATTGTNDFGFEVTVQDGIVTGAGGNDREIPSDGFVLSGHNGRGTWLQANAVLGAVITVDGATLTATIDERTAIYGAKLAIADSALRFTAATESCLDFPADSAEAASGVAADKLAEAEAAAESGDRASAVDLAGEARAAALLAGYRTAESRQAEGRATWVRPEETTPAAIDATLDRLDAAGFNMIFLETIYQGYTIFPSDAAATAGVAPQRPEMVGFDPLQVWIDGAHARGIELHPWVHTFFVGSDQTGGVGPVLTAHPDWAAIQRKDVGGPVAPSIAEPGYYFVDAANPEARAYVQSLLDELMSEYEIDGIHLDYIRYPVSLPWETAGYSYSDYSRTTFAAKHGVDPYTLTPEDSDWKVWTDWRIANVTSFVGEVRAKQEELKPAIALSAAVFADPVDGLDKKFQDWGDWVDRGYVDVLTGMSFGTSGASVARDTEVMRERVGQTKYLYTATYGPFRGSTPGTVVEQVTAVNAAGSDGVGLFAFNQLAQGQAEALTEGPHRVKAVAPHADPLSAAAVGIESLRQSVTRAAGTCADPDVTLKVQQRLDKALDSLQRDKPAAALKALNEAEGYFGEPTEAGPAAFAERAVRDLAMYERWLSTALESRG